MYIKRIHAWCCVVILALFVFFHTDSVFANDNPAVTFSVGDVFSLPGEEILLPVSFSGNEGFSGMVFTVTFDSDILSPKYDENINSCFQKNLSDVPVNYYSVKYTKAAGSSYATLCVSLAITENVTIESGLVGSIRFTVNSGASLGKSIVQIHFDSKGLTCKNEDTSYSFAEAKTENGSVTVCDICVDGEYISGDAALLERTFTVQVPSFEGANMILTGYDAAGKQCVISMQSALGNKTEFTVDNDSGIIHLIKIFTLQDSVPAADVRSLGSA